MTPDEYKERMNKINADHEAAKKSLYKEYAMSNLKFKIGDIIKDSRYTVLIDRITTYVGFGLPEPVYEGFILNKDFTINKRKERGAMYGNDSAKLLTNH